VPRDRDRPPSLRKRLIRALLIETALLIFRLVALTWRIRWQGFDGVERLHAEGKRVIYAFWHQRMMAFVHSHRGRKVQVLISRHGDGEIIARLVERQGFGTVRGSSTRGAVAALKGLIDRAREGHDLGVTPDGPKGPPYVVKPGVIQLAAKSGLPVVCCTNAPSRAWVFWSWDRFLVPKPFATLHLRFGEPIAVPPCEDESAVERERLRVETYLRRITEELEREVGVSWSGPTLPGRDEGREKDAGAAHAPVAAGDGL